MMEKELLNMKDSNKVLVIGGGGREHGQRAWDGTEGRPARPDGLDTQPRGADGR